MTKPEFVGDPLPSVADSIRGRFTAGEFSRCSALVAPANYCADGKHGVATDMGAGQFLHMVETGECSVRAAVDLVRLRREILATSQLVCEVAGPYRVAWTVERPLWSQLMRAMNREAAVTWTTDGRAHKPLASLIDKIDQGCRMPNKTTPHLLLQGSCGTGKTTLQAVLYLAAREAGLDAAFVDSIGLRTLATSLSSRFSQTAEAAGREFEKLVQRDVIAWSDVGDTQATCREFSETITSLLGRFSGRLIASSNEDPDQLAKHPDIGHRAVSRMLASRHGKSAVIVQLSGPDQRKGTAAQGVLEL